MGFKDLKQFLLERIPGYTPQSQVLPASQAVIGRGGLTPQQALAQKQALEERQRYFTFPDGLVEVEKFDGLVLKVVESERDYGNTLDMPRGSQHVKRPLFLPNYVLGNLPSVTDKFTLNPFESELFTLVREAREYLKMPNKEGIWNFLATVYMANAIGLAGNPQTGEKPVNVWLKFRPDIGFAVRNHLIDDGIALVAKKIRYGTEPEQNARKQLDVVDIGAALFGIELGGIIPGRGIGREALFGVTKLFRDHCRISSDLALSDGKEQRASEIRAAYSSWTIAYGMPLPLHTLRLGTGNITWKS